MCGISLLARDKRSNPNTACPQYWPSLQKECARRGPHHHNKTCIDVGTHALHLSTSVLSLRGAGLIHQPLYSTDGQLVLAWNGQVYGLDGHRGRSIASCDLEQAREDLRAGHNDGLVVLSLIEQAIKYHRTANKVAGAIEAALGDVTSSLDAEWALVLVQTQTGKVYFGRDPIGRRSLLFAFGREPHNIVPALLLTSVASQESLAAGVSFSEIDCMSMWTWRAAEGVRRILDRRQDRILLAELQFTGDEASSGPYSEPTQVERSSALDSIKQALFESISARVNFVHGETFRRESEQAWQSSSTAMVAVLFSGGLDSTLLAYMAHLVISDNRPIELINVAFENPRVLVAAETTKTRGGGPNNDAIAESSDRFDTPDRILSRKSLARLRNLSPNRAWQSVEINVPYSDYLAAKEDILATMFPCDSVMDLSLAAVLFFASRGTSSETQAGPVTSRVYLSGLGADELFGGYSRHFKAFAMGQGAEGQGWPKAAEELQLDLDRLPARNLGRDDRILSSHGREGRYPFLSLPFIRLAAALPLRVKVDFAMESEQGRGDKCLLRDLARRLGLVEVSSEKKRAMQFGARSAKMEHGFGRRKGHESLSAQVKPGKQPTVEFAFREAALLMATDPGEVFTTLLYDPQPRMLGFLSGLMPQELADRWLLSSNVEGIVASEYAAGAVADEVAYHELSSHVPLLQDHFNRLRAASEALTKAFPSTWGATRNLTARRASLDNAAAALDTLQRSLNDDANAAPDRRKRVRWALSIDGQWHVVQSVAAPPPSSPPLVRLDSMSSGPTDTYQDLPNSTHATASLYIHKTDVRKHYDEARTRVNAPLAPLSSALSSRSSEDSKCPVFDVLMWQQVSNVHSGNSTQAVLTESSIANILVERSDGAIVTPRLSSHLKRGEYSSGVRGAAILPGLMRQALLERGWVREEDIFVESGAILDVHRVWLCNALRGVFEVQVVT